MNKNSLGKKLLAAPYLVWSAIFIIVPLFYVTYYALTDSAGNFSLDNIWAISEYTDVMLNSIWLGFIATIVCLILAYPLAYIMSRSKMNTQRTIMMLVMIPMWTNLLIRTYSLMILLQDTGIINSFLSAINLPTISMINTDGAVVLGMVYNYIPYMILPLYSIMAKLDHSLIEAAEDLGASKLSVIQKVILPLTTPGIVSGLTMVFVPSVSTFYISKKLGGTTFSLIGDVIEMQFKSLNNYSLGSSLSLVLMLMIFVCMMIMNKFAKDEDGGVLI